MKILHLDPNHQILISELERLGFQNDEDCISSKAEIMKKINHYDGIIIRSRFPIDAEFLQEAKNLKFIGRVGAGLENIDEKEAKKRGIKLYNAPEGNRNAVGEHALGMLLSLMNKLHTAHQEVCEGIWKREENRGVEIEGKCIGIIGYGNMGKAFAKKLLGFDCEVIFYDIKNLPSNEYAKAVSLKELQQKADVLSLHTPLTSSTINLIDQQMIEAFAKPFWLINTARGKSVVTKDLVAGLKSGKILGAGLDVLEYEKSSFESLFEGEIPPEFNYLIRAKNVLLSPHIGGWTVESKQKLAQTIVDKIARDFGKKN